MTLQEKIDSMVPEQKEKLKNANDKAQLKEVLNEAGIELTEDELELVAGGLPILRPITF